METLLALPTSLLPFQCRDHPNHDAHTRFRQQQQQSDTRGNPHRKQPSQDMTLSSSPSSSAKPSHLCNIACIVGLAISLSSSSPAFAYETDTPYSQSQSQTMQMGLLNGKIRPCPSNINPNCISTSSMNATFAIPFEIPPEASESATRKLLSAIQGTQKNTKVLKLEDTPTGQFLQVEVDGVFGRDIMEFLVKNDVVTYRSLAEKVLYIYPFTTPISDFGAQDKRIKAIQEELGWSVPTWDLAY
eukprot:c23698_g2_i7 orf=76-807(+)